ncbi:MAG: DUF4065 domain-containing protein [Acidimicrobiales bacterium]|nr:DUF4065 domain-containing protein [Acidimicrobiaceae bacterium]MXV86890.1 DUF4065 domain-containing protein [Acidimicrobiales bacterium]MXX43997.1 DUF4065 domain-containing protein [Acidimicrobiales bacterium]MYB82963.1 DUF4065 domain-containing protein [Acidimicrobiales bacterium]MYD32854.1 DUF4065 domain-containing protein [Acidimicrobiales bacterium]
MVLLNTDPDRAAASIHALLVLAARRALSMTRTKVVKLLYLADLRCVAATGTARSGILWRWWHYGPYCQSLRSAEDALVNSGAVERESWRLSAYATECRLEARPDAAIDLMLRSDELLEHLGAVLQEHGHKNARALTDIAYSTAPMLEAQSEGTKGMLLDLDEQPEPADMDMIKAELAERFAHVADADLSDVGPDGLPDVSELVGTLRGNRAYANSLLLD